MSILYICAIAAFSQNIETDYYLYFVKNTTFFCHMAFADDVFSVISMTFPVLSTSCLFCLLCISLLSVQGLCFNG